MSGLYLGAEITGALLVHDETLTPAAPLPSTTTSMASSPWPWPRPAATASARRGAAPPPLVASGGGVLLLARADGAVRLLHSTLPYEASQASLLSRFGMAAVVVVVTVLWQLYRRKGGGVKKGGRGREEAEEPYRNSRAMQGMRQALGDDGAAEQLYRSHMRSYGQPPRSNGKGRGRHDDDSD